VSLEHNMHALLFRQFLSACSERRAEARRRSVVSLLAVAIATVSGCRAMERAAYRPEGVGRLVTNERWRSGVPLGGIGCGKIELLTDGAFGNFTINHNWDRPTRVVRGTFFALRAGESTTLLRLKREGEYDAVQNVTVVSSNGLFPRAYVAYRGLPVDVDLEAFSPLIPHNAEDSSLPIAFFTFKVTSAQARSVTLLFSWENLLGWGGRAGTQFDDRSGNAHQPVTVGAWTGLRFTTTRSKPDNVTGEYLIVSDGPASTPEHWDPAAGMIGRQLTLSAGQTATVRFVAVWFMPKLVTEFEKTRKETQHIEQVDAAAAIDADPETKWETDAPTHPGEQLVLDLGSAKPLDGIVLDNFASQGDFTSGFELEASPDGQAWQAVEHEREKVRRGVAEFSFARREDRYYRVTQRLWGPDWRWTVASVKGRLAGSDVAFVAATGRVHKKTTDTAREDVGHYYLNRFPDAVSLAAYAIENQERLDAQTREWQDLTLRSSLPEWLKIQLLNHSFPAVSNTVFTRDGRFSVLESPVSMGGALGTMDQRMAHHGFWTMLFPDLDRRELELFAAAQDRVEPLADGRIPHFCGNVHHSVGDPMVGYGTTDWPDLSCSWVMQVLKWYRWTGDRGFFERMWPHAKRAMAWLAGADTDGDLIPEGGSTYDYEHLPRGAYVYIASCYLGALRAATEMARLAGEPDVYTPLFTRVQESVIERLWDGQQGTFVKWRGPPGSDEIVRNSFVAPLAGDWLVRLTGLEPTLPPEKVESTIRETLARHAKSFGPIPPMEVTPEGDIFTPTCFVLQHTPFLACEAIYLGHVDDGFDVVRRIYEAAWEINHSPWDLSLVYESPGGRQASLLTYMTATSVWHLIPALTGMTVDLTSDTLLFWPNAEYHGPVFFPTFWAWLNCANGRATLRVVKVFKPGAVRRVNDSVANLAVAEGAVWDLSAFARLPKNKAVAAKFARKRDNPRDAHDGWTVRTSRDPGDFDVPPIRFRSAIDGNPVSRWTTSEPMKGGEWFQADLGRVMTVPGIRVDSARSPNDYPRGLRVETSTDARHWTPVIHWDEGQVKRSLAGGVLTIPFHARARHIKLTQLGTTDFWWWSIHEFDLLAR